MPRIPRSPGANKITRQLLKDIAEFGPERAIPFLLEQDLRRYIDAANQASPQPGSIRWEAVIKGVEDVLSRAFVKPKELQK